MVKNPPATWETQVPSLGWEGPLAEGMAIHSSILDWRIPWTEELGGLQSIQSKMPWRRAWQPTLVFLSGESNGQRSLVGCSPQGSKEADTTEAA